MRLIWSGSVLLLFCWLVPFPLQADQPVMNEVPRWRGGYGAQVFQEFRWADDLLRGSTDQPNPANLEYEKRITHFEAVYTWRSWIRVTAKIPWVDQKRRTLGPNGEPVWQRGEGLDDVKLALPVRRYINKPRSSGHVGIVPQIRFGGDNDDVYAVSDGSTDWGLSVTAELETSVLIIGGDVTYWDEQDAEAGDEWSVDFGLGWNFHDRGSVRWETEYIDEHRNDEWLGAGPTLFWNFNDVVLSRIEYKFALYESVDGIGIARGDTLRMGVGLVF